MHTILQDIRFALRTLRKTPGFTAVAIITLALGIGANTAIFTVVNAVFFHPLPITDPEHIVSLFTTDVRNRGGLSNYLPISHPNAEDIARSAQSFSTVAITTGSPVSMTIGNQPQQFNAEIVSGNYFDLLGVHAALGRTFRPEEADRDGAGPVIVLSHGTWVRHFSSDPNVISRTVLLNGLGFTIVGVMPRGFQGEGALGGPDLWVPMSMHQQVLTGFFGENYAERRFLGFAMLGRLKPGVTVDNARAELKAIGNRLEHDFPVPNKDRSFTAVPLLQSTINPNVRDNFVRAGGLMMTVVGLVLLIACANIANLLLARAAGRKREISIRLALGASRSRIVRQLLTEAVMLALAGGAVGLGLAIVARNLLWQFRPPFLQDSNMNVSLDARVLLFTLGIAVLTGLIFGLAPATQSTRPDLVSELKERTGGDAFSGRRFGLRGAFVVVQFALSLVALIGAGLFVISLRNAQKIDPGFDTHNLTMMSFDVGALNYDVPRQREFQRRVLETARAVPGVKAATLASNVPLFAGGFARSVFPEGQEGSQTRSGVLAQIDPVAPGYFQTMGIPLMRGRAFDDSIHEDGRKVAIINQAAAKRFWPNEEAVGKRFKFFGEKDFVEVIGVARDAKYVTLGEEPTPYMYLPLIQNPSPATTLFIRSEADPNAVLSSVRTQVQTLDRNLPLTNVWPIGEVISQALWGAKFGAGLLSIFAGLAVVLAAIGIYGVVAYSVGQRVREIGIRMALGAHPRDVLMMFLRQSGLVLGVGLAVGMIAAFALAQAITSLLYGITGAAPLPFTVLPIALAVVGLLATYIPARRAAKVDPMVALRYE